MERSRRSVYACVLLDLSLFSSSVFLPFFSRKYIYKEAVLETCYFEVDFFQVDLADFLQKHTRFSSRTKCPTHCN